MAELATALEKKCSIDADYIRCQTSAVPADILKQVGLPDDQLVEHREVVLLREQLPKELKPPAEGLLPFLIEHPQFAAILRPFAPILKIQMVRLQLMPYPIETSRFFLIVLARKGETYPAVSNSFNSIIALRYVLHVIQQKKLQNPVWNAHVKRVSAEVNNAMNAYRNWMVTRLRKDPALSEITSAVQAPDYRSPCTITPSLKAAADAFAAINREFCVRTLRALEMGLTLLFGIPLAEAAKRDIWTSMEKPTQTDALFDVRFGQEQIGFSDCLEKQLKLSSARTELVKQHGPEFIFYWLYETIVRPTK